MTRLDAALALIRAGDIARTEASAGLYTDASRRRLRAADDTWTTARTGLLDGPQPGPGSSTGENR